MKLGHESFGTNFLMFQKEINYNKNMHKVHAREKIFAHFFLHFRFLIIFKIQKISRERTVCKFFCYHLSFFGTHWNWSKRSVSRFHKKILKTRFSSSFWIKKYSKKWVSVSLKFWGIKGRYGKIYMYIYNLKIFLVKKNFFLIHQKFECPGNHIL